MSGRRALRLVALPGLLLLVAAATLRGGVLSRRGGPQEISNLGQVQRLPGSVALPGRAGLPAGSAAPDFVRETLDGRELALADFGGKPLA